jgi:hypothetical protein
MREFSRRSHLGFTLIAACLIRTEGGVTAGIMKRRSPGGPARTIAAIGVLMAAGAGGLVALQSSLAPAPPRLPAPIVVFPGQRGTAARPGVTGGSSREGEKPESPEPVRVVGPYHTVIVVPAGRPGRAGKDR